MADFTGVKKEFKDIFEVEGVPAFRQFYNYGIFIWKYLYRGFYNAWHLVKAPTIEDPKHTRNMFYLSMPKAACSELAGLIWSEQCEINVNLPNFTPTETEPDDKLQRFINKVLCDNNFKVKMQEAIEQSLALGGEALKVWYEVKHDKDGNEIEGSGKIKIGYVMADQFVPTSWTNAEITEGVFISRIMKEGKYYTRLEFHKWDSDTYVVSNELYEADAKNANTTESQDILGYRIPLNTIYPFLNDETTLEGLEQSLFSYFRTPIANNVDDNSPLGISIYANALSTLHALDICYDSFVREFQLGKKRIIVPASAVRTVADPETGKLCRYFDASDEVYEALATDDREQLKISDNSVELRVDEHIAALNTWLSILCLQLGFSSNTFTFDAKEGLKTATEVVSENSKTYKTVKNCQNIIKAALYRLVENIIDVARLYEVEFEGEKVDEWFGEGKAEYCVNIHFDDAIIQDRQTNIAEGINLVANGLMAKSTFMTEKLGMTPEQAAAEIEKINKEKTIGVEAVDRLNLFTAE